jgi:tetratricopeptide (TPR) repeat protein
MMIGLCYGRMRENDKALQALETAVSKHPDRNGWSESTWFYLGSAYEGAGRTAEALQAYRQSVTLCRGAPTRKPDSFPWRDASERITLLESSGA